MDNIPLYSEFFISFNDIDKFRNFLALFSSDFIIISICSKVDLTKERNLLQRVICIILASCISNILFSLFITSKRIFIFKAKRKLSFFNSDNFKKDRFINK